MNKYGAIFHKIHYTSINEEDFKQSQIDLKEECIFKEINDPIFIIDNAGIYPYHGLTEIINN